MWSFGNEFKLKCEALAMNVSSYVKCVFQHDWLNLNSC
jgi:hypothetical protein